MNSRPDRSWWRALLDRASGPLRERDMNDEMRFHIQMEAQHLRERGASDDEAERLARVRFGGVERYKEDARDARPMRWLRDAQRDARQALRSLRRAPGFTVVAAGTLALGIGASTAIFTAVHGVLLRPLAYPEAGRLVRLTTGPSARHDGPGPVSYLDVLDFRTQSSSLADLVAYDEWTATIGDVRGEVPPEKMMGASVTSSFFSVLGVQPALGRFFRAEEDRPGHTPTVVLGYSLWRRRFGADPSVVGRTVSINGTDYRVAGVTRPDFEDPSLMDVEGDRPQLWRVSPAYFNPSSSSRSSTSFAALGRLRPGVSVEKAQRELAAIAMRLQQEYPQSNAGRTVQVTPLKEQMVAPIRPALLALFAATGLLVLIACANLANLLLARGAVRERELALRTALGAGRGRLVRQLIVESLVLAMIGGVMGVVLAVAGAGAIVGLAGEAMTRAAQVRVDATVLAYAAGTSLLTGLAFGIAPALRGRMGTLQASLKEGGRGSVGPGSHRIRDILVSVEVALALVLLASAGLVGRSLRMLTTVDPGFSSDGVLTMEVVPPRSYDSDEKVLALYDRLFAKIGAVPGVTRVGAVDILPMSGGFNGMGVAIAGQPAPKPEDAPSIETRAVTPGLFAALGVKLQKGRDVSASDNAASPLIAVVDEAFARRFFPGQDPIGQTVIVFDSARWQVVGVVRPVRQFTLAREPEPTLYLPYAQMVRFAGSQLTITVRTTGNPSRLLPDIRSAVWSEERGIAISRAQLMNDVVGSTASRQRLRAVLLGLLAGMAWVIGAVGIYGVVAYAVSQRMPEFGIRLALGASRKQIANLVMSQAMRPVVYGLVAGVIAALAVGRLLAGTLFGVTPRDPVTLIVATLGLAAIAAVAAFVPAQRATRADPIASLRSD